MSTDPVTASEIADLLRDIRAASHPAPADPAQRARLLERKADLLARIAHQRAGEWACEHATQAREVARDAQAIAEQAHRLAATPTPTPSAGGAKTQQSSTAP